MSKPIRTALDTSVLVSSLQVDHVHYALAAAYFDEARRGHRSILISSHALAETFSTLTSLPFIPRIPPTKVVRLIQESVLSVAEVVTLDTDDYRTVLDRLAELGLTSGAVYDALHVRAAEKAGADELVTFNGRDFRRMPPAEPCRLVVL